MNKVVRVVFASLIGGALAGSYGLSEIRKFGEELRQAERKSFALDLKLDKLKFNSQVVEIKSMQRRIEDTIRRTGRKIDEVCVRVDALCERIDGLAMKSRTGSLNTKEDLTSGAIIIGRPESKD